MSWTCSEFENDQKADKCPECDFASEMRLVRDIPPEEEIARVERRGRFYIVKRNPVEPEPVGTIVLLPFEITGYEQDCDGSLMAELDNLYPYELEGNDFDISDLGSSGWEVSRVGINKGIVISAESLVALYTHLNNKRKEK
jgi:hypothetical protein